MKYFTPIAIATCLCLVSAELHAQQWASGYPVFVEISDSDVAEVTQAYRNGTLSERLVEGEVLDVGVSRARLLAGELLSYRATDAATLVCLSRSGNASPELEDLEGAAVPRYHSTTVVRDTTFMVFFCED